MSKSASGRKGRGTSQPVSELPPLKIVEDFQQVIPLKNVKNVEAYSKPKQLAKLVRNECAVRYLESMGAKPTKANVEMVKKNLPLKDSHITTHFRLKGYDQDELAIKTPEVKHDYTPPVTVSPFNMVLAGIANEINCEESAPLPPSGDPISQRAEELQRAADGNVDALPDPPDPEGIGPARFEELTSKYLFPFNLDTNIGQSVYSRLNLGKDADKAASILARIRERKLRDGRREKLLPGEEVRAAPQRKPPVPSRMESAKSRSPQPRAPAAVPHLADVASSGLPSARGSVGDEMSLADLMDGPPPAVRPPSSAPRRSISFQGTPAPSDGGPLVPPLPLGVEFVPAPAAAGGGSGLGGGALGERGRLPWGSPLAARGAGGDARIAHATLDPMRARHGDAPPDTHGATRGGVLPDAPPPRKNLGNRRAVVACRVGYKTSISNHIRDDDVQASIPESAVAKSRPVEALDGGPSANSLPDEGDNPRRLAEAAAGVASPAPGDESASPPRGRSRAGSRNAHGPAVVAPLPNLMTSGGASPLRPGSHAAAAAREREAHEAEAPERGGRFSAQPLGDPDAPGLELEITASKVFGDGGRPEPRADAAPRNDEEATIQRELGNPFVVTPEIVLGYQSHFEHALKAWYKGMSPEAMRDRVDPAELAIASEELSSDSALALFITLSTYLYQRFVVNTRLFPRSARNNLLELHHSPRSGASSPDPVGDREREGAKGKTRIGINAFDLGTNGDLLAETAGAGFRSLTDRQQEARIYASCEEFTRLYERHRRTKAGLFFTMPLVLLSLRSLVERLFVQAFPLWSRTAEGAGAIADMDTFLVELLDPNGLLQRMTLFQSTPGAVRIALHKKRIAHASSTNAFSDVSPWLKHSLTQPTSAGARKLLLANARSRVASGLLDLTPAVATALGTGTKPTPTTTKGGGTIMTDTHRHMLMGYRAKAPRNSLVPISDSGVTSRQSTQHTHRSEWVATPVGYSASGGMQGLKTAR